MANSFYLSPLAEDDLRHIILYSRDNWGNQQAARYFQSLDSRFRWLADNPDLGKSCHHIKEDYLSFHEGRHVVFYTKITNGIAIARILHERMNFQRHL